ncbi:hypothetical protein IJL65_05585 [bacterium]|nr:hypothetical protein [bacterium]
MYNPANARFHINHTINHTIGNKTHSIFKLSPSDPVIEDIAVKAPNNKAATQTHTIAPMNIFPKKDPILTSFGALSNIATSGLFVSLIIFCGFNQI